MKRYIAALFLALVAFPSAASAVPPDYVRQHWAPPPLVVPDTPELATHLPAKGTDVAAPDQQASTPGPAPSSAPADNGFDWGDAGVGAIAGTALAAFAIAGAAGLRRRPATRIAG